MNINLLIPFKILLNIFSTQLKYKLLYMYIRYPCQVTFDMRMYKYRLCLLDD